MTTTITEVTRHGWTTPVHHPVPVMDDGTVWDPRDLELEWDS